MFFHDFPYTDFHELNLDWVIKKLKAFEQDLTAFGAEFEELKTSQDQVLAQMAIVLTQMDNILDTIHTEVENAVADTVPGYVDEAMRPYITDLNSALAEVESMKAQILGWQDQIVQLRADFTRADNNLVVDYTTKIVALSYEIYQQIDRLQVEIDNLQWQLPEVYNLVKGVKTNIVALIYDVYDAVRYRAYTALQFTNAGLTCTELDGLEKTALDWDVNGYDILYDPRLLCINPLTGIKQPICAILQDLALFSSERTWTALIWDEKENDADTIDGAEESAFSFDYSDPAIIE